MSLERTAYLAVFVFVLMATWKRSGSKMAIWTTSGLLLATVIFLFSGGMMLFGQFRDSESVWTLSERLGLWAYLSALTISKAPWTGLGYFAASRLYGPEYSEGWGTAHSMFIEAFVGAGFPALIALIVLCCMMAVYAFRVFFRSDTPFGLTSAGLLFGVILYGAVGAQIEAGPLAMAFWALGAMFSSLEEQIPFTSPIAGQLRHGLGNYSSS
jgi:hypothetical protein